MFDFRSFQEDCEHYYLITVNLIEKAHGFQDETSIHQTGLGKQALCLQSYYRLCRTLMAKY